MVSLEHLEHLSHPLPGHRPLFKAAQTLHLVSLAWRLDGPTLSERPALCSPQDRSRAWVALPQDSAL